MSTFWVGQGIDLLNPLYKPLPVPPDVLADTVSISGSVVCVGFLFKMALYPNFTRLPSLTALSFVLLEYNP